MARGRGWSWVVALGLASGCFGSSDSALGDEAKQDECVPYEDDCATGTYCQYAEGRTQCVAEGVVARDEPCDGQRCQRGSICMHGSELGDELICQQPCDLEDGGTYPCDLSRHTCFPAVDEAGRELSFGVCRYVP